MSSGHGSASARTVMAPPYDRRSDHTARRVRRESSRRSPYAGGSICRRRLEDAACPRPGPIPRPSARIAPTRSPSPCAHGSCSSTAPWAPLIQRHAFSEADYRGTRFADWPTDLKGNNDLLSLTQPDAIAGIHHAYLDAGADLIETNTFNAQRISLADYDMQDLAYEMNVAAARLARAGRRRGHGPRPGQAAVRDRRAGPHQPHRLDLARRQRPGRPQRHLRGAGRGLPGTGQRPGRRRRRRPDHRDDLRHAQRQGRDLRGRDPVRAARHGAGRS